MDADEFERILRRASRSSIPRPLYAPQWVLDRLTEDELAAIGRWARDVTGIGVQPFDIWDGEG